MNNTPDQGLSDVQAVVGVIIGSLIAIPLWLIVFILLLWVA